MPAFEDLTGKKIGYLSVLHRAPDWIQPSGQHKRMWHCLCICGKECDVRASDIKSGNTTSCGCQSSRKKSVGLEDLTGKQFGDYVVVKRAPNKITPSGQQTRVWHCKCINCSLERDIQASQLKNFSGKCSCNRIIILKNDFENKRVKGKKSPVRKITRLQNINIDEYDFISQWHKDKNEISPNQLTSVDTKVWWLGDCGHEWEDSIRSRKKGRSCPYCSNKLVLSGFNDLKTCNQELANQWHPTKNGNLKANQILPTCNKKVWWFGKCGHEWCAAIYSRNSGAGCPICSNRYYVKGYNDLKTLFPEIAKQWHPSKNGELQPEDVFTGYREKVWWLGDCGHEWHTSIASRKNGNGCPICSNRQTLQGFNDFATLYPELLSEWDYDKNSIKPEETSSLNTLVWWKCGLGHSFDMKMALRVGKQRCGCPYCSIPAKKILKGFNDLATTHPKILSEWDYEKNTISPEEISAGSAKKVWWKCKIGHSFEQSIVYKSKSELESTCPYCSHQKLLKGFNDLATTHAYILEEWDYEKNKVLPTQIGVGSHEKIWWKCPFGHSYQTYPSNRCGKQRTGCPICDKENHTSFPEQAVLFYVRKYFPNAINSDRQRIGMELDIYIPELDIAIEYDGETWHNNNVYELKKNAVCKQKEVLLVRIREKGLKIYDDCICLVRGDKRSNESLTKVISELLMLVDNIDADIDVERDASSIYSSYIETRKSKSLASVFPEIASEWHPLKNGHLTPMMVAPIANKKVWWLGKCGHEYQMNIGNRTYQNCGCPYCSGKRILIGFNDFETWCKANNMALLEEWDYSRNSILPTQVSKSSDKVIYWRCKRCSNSWKAKVDTRTRMKSGCPQCASYYRNAKSVINLDTGVIYESIQEAGEKTNINSACIGNVCRGKQKKAGGYRWAYYDDK